MKTFAIIANRPQILHIVFMYLTDMYYSINTIITLIIITLIITDTINSSSLKT